MYARQSISVYGTLAMMATQKTSSNAHRSAETAAAQRASSRSPRRRAAAKTVARVLA